MFNFIANKLEAFAAWLRTDKHGHTDQDYEHDPDLYIWPDKYRAAEEYAAEFEHPDEGDFEDVGEDWDGDQALWKLQQEERYRAAYLCAICGIDPKATAKLDAAMRDN